MVSVWISNFWGELSKPGGWSLAIKSVAGLVAFAGGLITVVSFVGAHRAQIVDSIHSRMSAIQNGLLSDSGPSRIAALRSLRAFANDSAIRGVSDDAVRHEAHAFARRALVEAIEASKQSVHAVLSIQDNRGRPVPPPNERYELLATLNGLGSASRHSRGDADSHAPPDFELDFMWLSRTSAQDMMPEAESLLSGFNFSDLKLSMARFNCLSLTEAEFVNAEIRQVRFVGSKLERSNFQLGRLHYVSFTGADLRAARFDGSEIEGAELSQPGSVPNNHNDENGCGAPAEKRIPLRNTNATSASFREARIYQSNFSGSDLQATRFDSANLSEVVFRNSILSGAIFDNAHLSAGDFTDAQMAGASFANATLAKMSFDNADLKNASFSGARFVDSTTLASLARAKSLDATNFGNASGISEKETCALLMAGAVFVDKEREWASEGRRREREVLSSYMSPKDRARVAACGSPPG